MSLWSLPRRSTILVAGGSVGLGLVVAARLALERRVLFDTEPWSPSLQRVALTLVTAATIACLLAGVRLIDAPLHVPDRTGERLSRFALGLAILPLAVVLLWPAAFDLAAREDRPVEMLSAAANFITAAALIRASSRSLRRWRGLLLAAAAVFTFIGLEEVSWFQRLLDFESPEAFGSNEQDEVNLHNFATDAFQSVYYAGAVLLMVVVPYLAACSGARWPATLRASVPGVLPVTLAVAATPYNYAETSYLASHIAFWLAFGALAMWPRDANRPRATVLLAYLAAGQAVMFAAGPMLPRDWAPSEYRELFLALAFLAWSVELMRSSALTAATTSPPTQRSPTQPTA